jgi:hypothetical protein
MPTQVLRLATSSPTRLAVSLGLSELLLTSIHHAYGAYAYATFLRLQVVGFAAVVALGIAGLSFAANRHQGQLTGRLLHWINMAVIVALPVFAIGVAEGGYNHLVKNLVFFTGNSALYDRMFPAPTYEVPTDWFFEVTGIAQFPVGLWAGWAAIAALFRCN